MKLSTALTLIIVCALCVFGFALVAQVRATAETKVAAIHAEGLTLAEIETTKRQEMIINARLQMLVNEINAPVESAKSSAVRQ